MPGRPAKVDHVRDVFVGALSSADSLVDAVVKLEGFNPSKSHTASRHVRRVVGWPFLGVVAAWEEFIEQSFVRYLVGAQSSSGYKPKLRLGAAGSISHAYHVLSGNQLRPLFRFSQVFRSFVDNTDIRDFPRGWTSLRQFIFSELDRLKDAASFATALRMRRKCREDFRAVALAYFATSEWRANSGISSWRLAVVGRGPSLRTSDSSQNYYQAFVEMFRELSIQIAP